MIKISVEFPSNYIPEYELGVGLVRDYVNVMEDGAGKLLLEPMSIFKSEADAQRTVQKYAPLMHSIELLVARFEKSSNEFSLPRSLEVTDTLMSQHEAFYRMAVSRSLTLSPLN